MLLSLNLRAAKGSSDFTAASLSYAQEMTPNPADVLWYRRLAPIWDEALPVGNGRLEAMVLGGANAGSNNGDLQASEKNASLMDGSGAVQIIPAAAQSIAAIRTPDGRVLALKQGEPFTCKTGPAST